MSFPETITKEKLEEIRKEYDLEFIKRKQFNVKYKVLILHIFNVEFCQISTPMVYTDDMILKDVEECALLSLKNNFKEFYFFNERELQQIKFSNGNFELIETMEDIKKLQDGAIIFINHIKRNNEWKILTHCFKLNEHKCSWCLKKNNPNIICPECQLAVYCCQEHFKIAEVNHRKHDCVMLKAYQANQN